MNMVSMGISKEGERRKYLPLEIRIHMYNDVHKLHNEGLGYRKIQREIYEKYGKQISRANISYWLRNKHHPLRKVNKLNEKPSPELSYIIGTIFSDGSKYFDNDRKYFLILAVKDYEFAKEFGRCLAKVLRRRLYKPFWNERKKQWIVECCSVLLYRFLSEPLKELRPYIEYSKKTVAMFLRALFDGEGSMRKRQLELYNTNKKLLNYVKYLLKKYFNIDTTGPHLKAKKGESTFLHKRIIKYNKNCYYIYVCANSLHKFYKNVNFTIQRKQQRLISAIK